VKVNILINALKMILKGYEREIEASPHISIIEQVYYSEELESMRRQIIIDYPIAHVRERRKKEIKDLYVA
jgi:hypothetical protein